MNDPAQAMIDMAFDSFNRQDYHDCLRWCHSAWQCDPDQSLAVDILELAKTSSYRNRDIKGALDLIDRLMDMGYHNQTSLQRERINCLRYLGRYQEAESMSVGQQDADYRALDTSWFLHRRGDVKGALTMTESGRPGLGWTYVDYPTDVQVWDGGYVDELLILPESGFGDQIIFCRWFDRVIDRVGHVLIPDSWELSDVMIRQWGVGVADVAQRFQTGTQAIAIMSLPTVLQDFDLRAVAYLSADESWVQYYDHHIPRRQPRIGISWSGNVTHPENHMRSVDPQKLIQVCKNHGEILSLQQDQAPVFPGIVSEKFDTWEQTLALIETCDVVVSVDTSISHAAAAMGKPTLVLTSPCCYYTWSPTGTCEASTWYQCAWSIPQQTYDSWQDVFDRLDRKLTDVLKNL